MLIQDLVMRGGERDICFRDINDVVFDHEKSGGTIGFPSSFIRGAKLWISVV